ncbi:hypothetical protein WBG78_15400 [Chryseolinea sp. T2]|uniref:hypothetical protein n=1 Tax=Chryseolinea sp. T2 TaxID=3129255 RepID=UPI003077BC0F
MTNQKNLLVSLCKESIRQKIERMRVLIQEAQQSANEETKSTAGDKYETARAMAQLEIEKYASQLSELQKQSLELEKINTSVLRDRIGPGSLVETSNGNFLITVNAGEFEVGGRKFYAVSQQSPIAQKMSGLTTNDSFAINGRTYTIVSLE